MLYMNDLSKDPLFMHYEFDLNSFDVHLLAKL